VWCDIVFFFFSSRRRHTRFDCDWSSDVCSSDLEELQAPVPGPLRVRDRQEVAAPDRSRVVDEDVDPAEATMDLAGDPLHFVELAEVAGDDEGLGAGLARDLPGRGLQGRLVARAQRHA